MTPVPAFSRPLAPRAPVRVLRAADGAQNPVQRANRPLMTIGTREGA